MTNYLLVIAEVKNFGRQGGVVNSEVLCRSLRAQVPQRRSDGAWEWRDANAVWLVSNPSNERALEEDSSGLAHPREDTALLRVDPPPPAHLRLSEWVPGINERVWMAGFPIRSARGPAAVRRM